MKIPIPAETAIISAVVSALVAILTLFIRQYFKERLAKIKSAYDSKATVEEAFVARRLQMYPKLVELIYRIRNMSRDISQQKPSSVPSLLEELKIRVKEYEDLLYQSRIDLQRDRIFRPAHQLKHLMFAICRQAYDLQYFVKHGNAKGTGDAEKKLCELNRELDEHHTRVIEALSVGDFPKEQKQNFLGQREFEKASAPSKKQN